MDEKNQEPLFPEDLKEMPPLDELEGMPPFDENWLSEDAFMTDTDGEGSEWAPLSAPETPESGELPEEIPVPEQSPTEGGSFFHAPEDLLEIPEPEVPVAVEETQPDLTAPADPEVPVAVEETQPEWTAPADPEVPVVFAETQPELTAPADLEMPVVFAETQPEWTAPVDPEVPAAVEDTQPEWTAPAGPEVPVAVEETQPEWTAPADPEMPAAFEDTQFDLSAPADREFMESTPDSPVEMPEPVAPLDSTFFQVPEMYEENLEPEAPDNLSPEPAMPQLLDEAEQQPVQEENPEMKKKKTTPVKKGRPRRKKGDGFLGIPHLLATILWLAIIVAVGSSLGKLLWVGAADVLAFGREDKTVTVTIVASDDINSIAAKLGEAGLVRYPELFKFYANLTGADEKITTGTFELNTILDYHALTRALSPSSSSRSVVTVTIPEGYNCRQIFNLLSASNVCAVDSLEEYAASGELGDYWFLENVTRGDKYCLEGFLFPDTYEFYENSTPKEALTRMLNGFQNRYNEDLIAQIDTLNEHLAELMQADGKSEEYIASHVYTIREVIIVASLIEKETAGSSESATIASVIYNRLFHWGDYPAYLNIDASILYVVDGDTSAFDTKLDSPFNTYTHTGLTPTPITNPGLNSIQAALNPESTGYYYYVLNPSTGLHQFSATQEEHDAWIDKFRSGSEE